MLGQNALGSKIIGNINLKIRLACTYVKYATFVIVGLRTYYFFEDCCEKIIKSFNNSKRMIM